MGNVVPIGLFLFVVVSPKEGKGMIPNVAVSILALGSLDDMITYRIVYFNCQKAKGAKSKYSHCCCGSTCLGHLG
jgi:hypothetical protein